MKSNSALSASEVFLSIAAIRVAALALLSVAWLVLPARPPDRQLACIGPDSLEPQQQAASAAGQVRVADERLRDMILHD
jgi:hypothetical protein